MEKELEAMKLENEKLKATIEEKDLLLAMQRKWIEFLEGGKNDGKRG